MTMILKIIGQWDGKYLMMLQIKIIRAVLNVLTYIITSDAACPISHTNDNVHSYRYTTITSTFNKYCHIIQSYIVYHSIDINKTCVTKAYLTVIDVTK